MALLLVFGRDLAVAASWITNLSERFTLRQAVDVATRTPVEVFAQFLDIFDYTAFMVLAASPLAVLIGVGPGLVMLPGSAFIPNDPRWAWVVETNEGITSLPTMGILVEWANGGILMVLLWIAFAVACWRAFSDMAELDPEHADSWLLGRGAFVVIAGHLPGADVSHLRDLAGVHGNGDRRRGARLGTDARGCARRAARLPGRRVMRVGVDATAVPMQPTGAGNYIVNLVRTLGQVDRTNEYVIFGKSTHEEDLLPNGGTPNVRFIRQDFPSRGVRLAWEQVGLPRQVRSLRLDVLHSPHYTMPLRHAARSVVTFCDMTFVLHPDLHERVKRILLSRNDAAAAHAGRPTHRDLREHSR